MNLFRLLLWIFPAVFVAFHNATAQRKILLRTGTAKETSQQFRKLSMPCRRNAKAFPLVSFTTASAKELFTTRSSISKFQPCGGRS